MNRLLAIFLVAIFPLSSSFCTKQSNPSLPDYISWGVPIPQEGPALYQGAKVRLIDDSYKHKLSQDKFEVVSIIYEPISQDEFNKFIDERNVEELIRLVRQKPWLVIHYVVTTGKETAVVANLFEYRNGKYEFVKTINSAEEFKEILLTKYQLVL